MRKSTNIPHPHFFKKKEKSPKAKRVQMSVINPSFNDKSISGTRKDDRITQPFEVNILIGPSSDVDYYGHVPNVITKVSINTGFFFIYLFFLIFILQFK